MTALLSVKNLDVKFPTRRGTAYAVQEVSFTLAPGEVLGLVGESGAGKSTVGNAIIDILEPPGYIAGGEILFKNQNLRDLCDTEMRSVRGEQIGMIFQDPQTSLNPLMTIGAQLFETIIKTTGAAGQSAIDEAINLLGAVGINEAKARLKQYPHQFSGGMRQRVVIALALAGNPDLIIADEPTTALDVSIQKQILDLIKKLCQQRNLGVIIITHDIGVIAEIADRVAVMYNGRIVETGSVDQVLKMPEHEYTKSLISAVPHGDRKVDRFTLIDYIESSTGEKSEQINVETHWLGQNRLDNTANSAIRLESVNKEFVLQKAIFKQNRKILNAVKDVSFEIKPGESFGLVGESGSGKSTVARIIAGLYKTTSGDIKLFNHDVLAAPRSRKTLDVRRDLQMIFQDPYSSLNARMRVMDIVAEPIRFHKSSSGSAETLQIVSDLITHVGLSRDSLYKYPHEFSGGQRQRISIARALASRPKILICDEPTSALDVSVQANILNLLKDLQDELGLTMLFISHDLPVIRQMCDRVAVMRSGEICEIAATDELFENPNHEYSQHLLGLMPRMDLFQLGA